MISVVMHCIPVTPNASGFDPFTLEPLTPPPCIPVFKNEQGHCKQLSDANLMVYIYLPYWTRLLLSTYQMHRIRLINHGLYSN